MKPTYTGVQVPITPALQRLAHDAEVEILAHVRRPTYTGVQAEGANYLGALGEWVFIKALRAAAKQARYAPRYDGYSDAGDVTVVFDGQPTVLDVKTRGKVWHDLVMIPTAQFENPNYHGDYIVGVRLEGTTGNVIGYCTRGAFRPAPPTVQRKLRAPAMVVPFDDLTRIEKLFEGLDDGRVTVVLDGHSWLL